MVISQPAVVVGGAYGEAVGRGVAGVRDRVRRLLRGRESRIAPDQAPPALDDQSMDPAGPAGVPLPAAEIGGWEDGSDRMPAADARRAQAALLRGLMLARKGCYDAAGAAFLEGLRLDREIDLAGDPEVWALPRGGLEAAAGAYERAGRVREASALAATVRRRFTPRAVPRPSAPADSPIPVR